MRLLERVDQSHPEFRNNAFLRTSTLPNVPRAILMCCRMKHHLTTTKAQRSVCRKQRHCCLSSSRASNTASRDHLCLCNVNVTNGFVQELGERGNGVEEENVGDVKRSVALVWRLASHRHIDFVMGFANQGMVKTSQKQALAIKGDPPNFESPLASRSKSRLQIISNISPETSIIL